VGITKFSVSADLNGFLSYKLHTKYSESVVFNGFAENATIE
tara:strand:- start:632 stop:754 length:123 start_codon:yes stop_codon:yes gene_type:complete